VDGWHNCGCVKHAGLRMYTERLHVPGALIAVEVLSRQAQVEAFHDGGARATLPRGETSFTTALQPGHYNTPP
jgi:hypothetical protein